MAMITIVKKKVIHKVTGKIIRWVSPYSFIMPQAAIFFLTWLRIFPHPHPLKWRHKGSDRQQFF
jgi:hypothetical protein